METLKARVEHGRLVLDEPTDLPEGTVLELLVAGDTDELSDAELAALRIELRRSYAEYKQGGTISTDELLTELRAQASHVPSRSP